MKLENQVVSLDLAKRLKEMGVKQESYFFWYVNEPPQGQFVAKDDSFVGFGGIVHRAHCSAFTVAELGEMLPDYIQQEDGTMAQLIISKHRPFWVADYQWGENMQLLALYRQTADTEADARAKMLIYLLENKLINLTNS